LTIISPIIRTIFIGTPDFAVPALQKLTDTRFRPELIITQPARPQGRRLKIVPSPVKQAAESSGFTVIEPESIKDPEVFKRLERLEPDIIITVAYGGFLPENILSLPPHGCINIHPSLLPEYRGATPINHALFDGKRYTGLTIAKMVTRMDSGPVLLQKEVPVRDEDNYTSLSERLANIGAELLIETLTKLERGEIKEEKQNESDATYCYKLKKEDMLLNWNTRAIDIHNRVRGLALEPGAITFFRGRRIKVMETELLDEPKNREPGVISDVIKKRGIVVSTRDKRIILTRVQPAGKRIMTAFEFNLGARIETGECFNSGISH